MITLIDPEEIQPLRDQERENEMKKSTSEKRAEELRRPEAWKRWARAAKVISMVPLEPTKANRQRYLVTLKPDKRFALFSDYS